MRLLLALLVCATVPAIAIAQADRYELGRRLRQFEAAWEQAKDKDGKRRAVAPLNKAVLSFFSFNFGGAGESLDRARHALSTEEASKFEIRWAESLWAQPESRLLDADQKELSVVIKPFYRVDGAVPKGAKIRVGTDPKNLTEALIGDLPMTVTAPLVRAAAEDVPLRFEVVIEDRVLSSQKILISRPKDLAPRLASLRKSANRFDKATTIEQATLQHLLAMLTDLAAKKTMETDIPAARLLTEAEAVADTIEKKVSHFDLKRAGEFWLRIPIANSTEPIRILVPRGLDKDKPIPIVFALHGAGGSENLFFDGYGNGITAKLSKERDWIMVATRAAGTFGVGGAPRVLAILEELHKRYPIDAKRVYLVGHSMGAGHVLTIAQQSPERFAGAAILGGGGGVRKTEVFKNLPLFVGCGMDDFAIGAARSLAAALKKVDGNRVQYREYENVEHLLIVREAMPDVFKGWDGK